LFEKQKQSNCGFFRLSFGLYLEMRYLVTAKLKEAKAAELSRAIKDGSLGAGSVAGGEYAHNMREARLKETGEVQWVETCFCSAPLEEERPYWEEFFELLSVKDAHSRRNCRDANGSGPWACCDCDCTAQLEDRLKSQGEPFLKKLLLREKKPAGGL
jgi:hypothetical protein